MGRMTDIQVENNVMLLKGQPVEKVTQWLRMLRLDSEGLKKLADRIGSRADTVEALARDFSRYVEF